MKKYTLFAFSLLALIACRSSQKIIENKSEDQATQSMILPDSIYRFGLSFFSSGSGIDLNGENLFNRLIQEFNEKNNVKISPEIINWGREGETKYCLKLSELSKQQQEQFIKETKELLKNAVHIRYSENSICTHKK